MHHTQLTLDPSLQNNRRDLYAQQWQALRDIGRLDTLVLCDVSYLSTLLFTAVMYPHDFLKITGYDLLCDRLESDPYLIPAALAPIVRDLDTVIWCPDHDAIQKLDKARHIWVQHLGLSCHAPTLCMPPYLSSRALPRPYAWGLYVDEECLEMYRRSDHVQDPGYQSVMQYLKTYMGDVSIGWVQTYDASYLPIPSRLCHGIKTLLDDPRFCGDR
jgi:hypothetical protein